MLMKNKFIQKILKQIPLKKFIKNYYKSIFAVLLLIPIYYLLYKVYIPKINAFGCFDDCNNFMRGYFVLSGRHLFEQVFSGHQPLGSYVSALIQFITQPQSIFELVLRHRQFILLFGFISNALLILRFGKKVLLFVILFEFSKFYIFGDRYLVENMVVYLLIYLSGLVYLKIQNFKCSSIDYVLSGLFCWFVVFARLPYAPLAIVAYIIIIWGKPFDKFKKISLSILVILSFITIFMHNLSEYFFDVIVFNSKDIVNSGIGSNNLPGQLKLMQTFFYPVYVLFAKKNFFWDYIKGIRCSIYLVYFKIVKRQKIYYFRCYIANFRAC